MREKGQKSLTIVIKLGKYQTFMSSSKTGLMRQQGQVQLWMRKLTNLYSPFFLSSLRQLSNYVMMDIKSSLSLQELLVLD